MTTDSPDGHYTVSLVAGSIGPAGYTARATAKSSSPQTADQRCRTLELVVAGGSIRYRSLSSGGTLNADPDPCWVR